MCTACCSVYILIYLLCKVKVKLMRIKSIYYNTIYLLYNKCCFQYRFNLIFLNDMILIYTNIFIMQYNQVKLKRVKSIS